ncbi:cohesin domain-containing protein [Priestia koreensis]|uniref:cohesin domain-containing protein n=1 Tax=Priestia koreensis TaxID=284581 RepID=UPI003458CD26
MRIKRYTKLCLIMVLIISSTFLNFGSRSKADNVNRHLKVIIDTVSSRQGQQVTVPVSIKDVGEGISSYNLQLDYNHDDLEIVSISSGYGSILSNCYNQDEGCFYSSFNNSEGWLRAVWNDPTGGDHPIQSNQSLFKVVFKIKGKSLGAKPITIDETRDTNILFLNKYVQKIPFYLMEGKVIVQGANSDNGKTEDRDSTGIPNVKGPTANVTIFRQTENNKKLDQVVMNRDTTDKTIETAIKSKQDIINIRIPNRIDDLADETTVNVLKPSVNQLSINNMNLNIQTNEVNIQVPKQSIQGLNEGTNDLFFRIVPIRKEDEKKQVVEETLNAEVVKEAAGGKEVQVLEKPMRIETNYKSQKTFVTFLFKDIIFPRDKEEKEKFLKQLAVFVQHSDGEKVIQRGTIKYDEENNPIGIEIPLLKFSTFAIIGLPNGKPVANNIKISGDGKVGATLTASYTYTDVENDQEGTSIFRWYRLNGGNNEKRELIKGANKISYTLTKVDKGKYVGVEVTPVAKTGEELGQSSSSLPVGPIGPQTIPNSSPTVKNLKINGQPIVNQVLKVTYTYQDKENDKQGESLIKWFRVSPKTKAKQLIKEQKGTIYKLSEKDQGAYIVVEVTPIAVAGVKLGTPVTSSQTSMVIFPLGNLQLRGLKDLKMANHLAYLIKTTYQGKNIKIVKKGQYYQVSADFINKKRAQNVGEDMKKNGRIKSYILSN